jgi:hypothetical protein
MKTDEAVTLSVTLVCNAHSEAKSYSDNVAPIKHYRDNSKHVPTDLRVLDKHSVAW